MKISRFISGSVTEVVQGLLQAQKATVILAVGSANTQGTKPPTGGGHLKRQILFLDWH